MIESPIIRIGDWTARPTLNRLERDGRSVKLEPRAMEVLVYLASRAGEVISADELIDAVWESRVVGDGAMYQSINQLRQALGDSTQDVAYIETIPKRGYRLTAAVSSLDLAANETSDFTDDRYRPKWKTGLAGASVSQDFFLARACRVARCICLADGPDQVHMMQLGRNLAAATAATAAGLGGARF